MLRSIYRALAMGSLAAALLLATSPTLVLAEDEKPEEQPAEEPAGIEWVKGWDAGRAQAKKDGKLIFLYFGRYSPR